MGRIQKKMVQEIWNKLNSKFGIPFVHRYIDVRDCTILYWLQSFTSITITPAYKVYGFIGITCLSICLCVQKCPVHIFPNYGRTLEYILLHTKIVYNLNMCHDYQQTSFGQVQGQWKGYCFSCPIFNFLAKNH